MQPPCFCDYGTNIELGARVFFNFNCIVLDVCRVRIGDYTLLGPSVQVYTPMHPLNAEQRRREEFGKPVDIGADVWIGGGAIILPGVRIGSGAVIGAGSVVARDVPERTFAAGNPCRVIREIVQPEAPGRDSLHLYWMRGRPFAVNHAATARQCRSTAATRRSTENGFSSASATCSDRNWSSFADPVKTITGTVARIGSSSCCSRNQ